MKYHISKRNLWRGFCGVVLIGASVFNLVNYISISKVEINSNQPVTANEKNAIANEAKQSESTLIKANIPAEETITPKPIAATSQANVGTDPVRGLSPEATNSSIVCTDDTKTKQEITDQYQKDIDLENTTHQDNLDRIDLILTTMINNNPSTAEEVRSKASTDSDTENTRHETKLNYYKTNYTSKLADIPQICN